ncbi:MAG TPA: cyclase family protein [Dehalococcoidia bacterium]|nr:cyclase family protein [Dehalococcoidia bacterium]
MSKGETGATKNFPLYDDLPVKPGAPKGSAWGVFGDRDELGCLNFLTPTQVLRAVRLVRRGAVFPLNLPLDEPQPPLFGRGLPEHQLLASHSNLFRDDYLNNLWPQSSSQWDGLRHIRHPQDGFYNGTRDEEIISGGGRLGIERAAQQGICGRGVLVDVERWRKEDGRPINQQATELITPDMLEECLEKQGVQLEGGDILLVHTGWLRWYREEATAEQKQAISGKATAASLKAPGLGPTEEIAAFLWDLRVTAVASDNATLEAWPPQTGSGFLHAKLIPHLGMLLGELWYLQELAADCAEDGAYEFLLVSVPINIRGGVASPANAVAIK